MRDADADGLRLSTHDSRPELLDVETKAGSMEGIVCGMWAVFTFVCIVKINKLIN